MNDIVDQDKLSALIQKAAKALDSASTAAEVLDAKNEAGVVYEAAKLAERMAKAKGAHDTVIAACQKAMGDAVIIEAEAKRRLADEYDGAKARGEVRGEGRPKTIPNENSIPTQAELGINPKDVMEGRRLNEAEKAHAGAIKAAIDAKLALGEAPMRADLRRLRRAAKPRDPTPEKTPRRHKTFRRTDPDAVQAAAKMVLDEGFTLEEAAAQAGLKSVQPVKVAVAHEEGARTAVEEMPPDDPNLTLNKRQQRLFDRKMKELETLQKNMEELINQEAIRRNREHIEMTYLPNERERVKKMEEALNWNNRGKAVFTNTEYRLVWSVLNAPQACSPERSSEAFRLFSENAVKLRGIDPAEKPLWQQIPRTVEELEARYPRARRKQGTH